MKSRILQILSVFLLLGGPVSAESFRPALLITHADGSSVKYSLEKLPVLSFQDEVLQVKFQGQTSQYPRTDLESLIYVDDPLIPSAIGSAGQQPALAVTFYDRSLSVYTPESVLLSVFTLDGKRVWDRQGTAGSRTRLEYADLLPGVYVLKCGSHTYKFVVR